MTNALRAGFRRYLYCTAGITGAAIMIIEILGAKMLSPYVGTSHFVWTAQIAVTLVALACGYYAGGRLVDRSPRLGRLYAAILVAALFLACSVTIREWVVYRFLDLPLAAASLLASAFLFFIPLCLLAMTGPFIVRVVTSSLTNVGRNVGRLTAISTLGSFLGTVAIGYILIPLMPNSITMYATAGLLAGIAGGYFLIWGRKASVVAGISVVVAVGLAAALWGIRAEASLSASKGELFRGNSNFGILQVLQPKGRPYRYYLNDYLIQNTYDTVQGKSISMFTYMLQELARAYVPQLEDALCIGMGIGIVPRELARDGVRVDVVEINSAVVQLARRYFGLDPSAFRLFIGDGRYFVNRSEKRYDAVILDAFLGDSVPTHLLSRESFLAIKRVLKPDGVLVINTFVNKGSPRDFLSASLSKTLASVFASVRAHGVREGNTLFVASQRAGLSLLHAPDFSRVHSEALSQVREAFAQSWEPDTDGGLVLTDDYNPVEFYDAGNREWLRRALAMSMKNLR